MLNMTCRDPTLHSEVVQDVRSVFDANMVSYQIPQEVNEIFFCWSSSIPRQQQKQLISDASSAASAATAVKGKISRQHPAIKAFEHVNATIKEEFLDIAEAMAQLKVVE